MTVSILGIGEILWDILPEGRQLGGAPANFAYHCTEMGARGHLVSCVGDDELGHEALQKIRAVGLDDRHIAVDTTHATGTATVEVDQKGAPSFVLHHPVAYDFIPFSNELSGLAASVDAVAFGTLAQRSAVSRKTIHDVLTSVSDDCLRVFDINLRQQFYTREVIAESLDLASVLKINDEELPAVAEMFGVEGAEPLSLIEKLAERFGLGVVALTRGDQGSLLWQLGELSEHEGCHPRVVDSVGAGDAFTAVLVSGLLHSRKLDDINIHANRVAAFVCEQHGATPDLPDELRQF